MSESIEQLKPCPFCGEVPEFPAGDGTQYEIECCKCGHSMVGVQIADLMEIKERLSAELINCRYAETYIERAKTEAIIRWNTRANNAEITALREENERLRKEMLRARDHLQGLSITCLGVGCTPEGQQYSRRDEMVQRFTQALGEPTIAAAKEGDKP